MTGPSPALPPLLELDKVDASYGPFRALFGVSLTVPISKVQVTGPAGKSETWGFNDPAIGFHKNIFGLPALTEDRIAEWIPKTFLSFHMTVNPPLGGYDRNSTVNTGANRWAFTPLVNLDIPLNNDVAWFDVYVWGRFFTNNHEFRGNNLLSQHPLGATGAWYSHNIGKKMWAAIGVYYDTGDRTPGPNRLRSRSIVMFTPED